MAEMVAFIPGCCNLRWLGNTSPGLRSVEASHLMARPAIPKTTKKNVAAMRAEAGPGRDRNRYTKTALGFLIADAPPQPDGAPVPNKKPKAVPKRRAVVHKRGQIVPSSPPRSLSLTQGPEAVLGIVFVVLAYLKDLADHIGRLGTGLENLSDADLERHLRRALGRVEALESAQEVEREARRELEARLKFAEENRHASLDALRQAQDEADSTGASLASALDETRAELAAAENALSDLRANKGVATSTNPAGNKAVSEAELKAQQEVEIEQARIVEELQKKLEASAEELNQEIATREQQQKRLGELEALSQTSQSEWDALTARSLELEGELADKTEDFEKTLDASKKEAEVADLKLKGLIGEKIEMEAKLEGMEKEKKERERQYLALQRTEKESALRGSSAQDALAQLRIALEKEAQKNTALSEKLAAALELSGGAVSLFDDLAHLSDELDDCVVGSKDVMDRLRSAQSSAGQEVADLAKTLETHFKGLEAKRENMEQANKELLSELEAKDGQVRLLEKSEMETAAALKRAQQQLSAGEETNQAFQSKMAAVEAKIGELQGFSDAHMTDVQQCLDEQLEAQAGLVEELRAAKVENESLKAQLVDAAVGHEPVAEEDRRRDLPERGPTSTNDYLANLTGSRTCE